MKWQFAMRAALLFTLLSGATFSQVPPEREIVLGHRLVSEITSKQNVVTDPEVTEFVDGVLKALSRGQALRLPLKVTIVDTSERFSSALPGGNLMLSVGAILAANNEAELAGLLSHAMGHVQSGQSFKQNEYAGIPLIFVGGPWGSCLRDHAFLPPSSAQADVFEIQADMLGLGYLMGAGYDPQSLVSVFGRWSGKFGPIEQVGVEAVALGRFARDATLNTSAFDQFKSRLARRSVPRPDNPLDRPPIDRPPTLHR